MRTRIKSIVIDGQVKVVKARKVAFNFVYEGALITSENPKHAASNVRKVVAHARNMKRWHNCAAKAQRVEMFFQHGAESYKQAYGL